ncbi:protein of unknown function [Lachnospiraceae bacterium NLAE-zl-G231]|nr:protein of unknown function [Lachnospiraceae bacterium NLAE-zl-G231]
MIKIMILCIAGALFIGLVLFMILRVLRARRNSPSEKENGLPPLLKEELEDAGFSYDRHQDIFCSNVNCWQRKMGYCRLYDEVSPGFHMVMHCEPVAFSYNNKRWLIEFWKGQYGITTGGEIGIYNTEKEDITVEGFTGPFYESVQDSEMLPMSFTLRKYEKPLFSCSAVHWWLTGFRPGEFSFPDTLSMDARIQFPDYEMQRAFTDALIDLGYQSHEYAVRGDTVVLHYTMPHSKQPITRNSFPEALIQKTNRNYCKLYNEITGGYENTPDKLEYLKNMAPKLFEFCLHSLYTRDFYEAFSWMLNLIRDNRISAPDKRRQRHVPS